MDPLTRIRIGLAYVRDRYRLRPPPGWAPPRGSYARGGHLPPAPATNTLHLHVRRTDNSRSDSKRLLRDGQARGVGRRA